jgi:hypothetical protein
MSDSTAGTPEDDLATHDGQGAGAAGPAGPHSAGDTLGGADAPTGNDGTLGADAPAGDASLAQADVGAAALPDGADTPSEVFGSDDEGA